MAAIDSSSLVDLPEYKKSIRSFATRLAAGIIFFNLLVLCLLLFVVAQVRHERADRAKIASQNIARILEHDISSVFDKINFALFTLADEVEWQCDDIDKKGINRLMAKQVLLIPEVDTVLVTDSKGDVVYAGESVEAKKINVADRDYFIRSSNDFSEIFYISRPLLSKLDNKWIIVLCRRLNHPDGSFLGVALAILSLDYFSNIFATLDIGAHGGISLRDEEMGIMARYPAKDISSIIGNKTLSPELHKLFAAGETEGTFFTPTSWDNTAKVVSFRKIGKYPLFLNIGIATEDYLAGWWRETINIFLLSAFLSLATLLLAIALFVRYKREKLAQINVCVLNEDLERRVVKRTLELQSKNMELETALQRVHILEGILPICMYCKKIRDDSDSWQQLEKYITEHSQAQFSHGICPKCLEEKGSV